MMRWASVGLPVDWRRQEGGAAAAEAAGQQGEGRTGRARQGVSITTPIIITHIKG